MIDVHDPVIDRLRSALDEVAAGADLHEDGLIPLRTATSTAPRRWLGAVAAIMLVAAGATVALVVRSADEPVGSDDVPTQSAAPTATEAAAVTEVPSTGAVDTVLSTEVSVSVASGVPWFSVSIGGLTSGDLVHRQLDDRVEQLTQSWVAGNGETRMLLRATIAQGLQPGVEGDYTVEDLNVDDGTAYFLQPNDNGAPMDFGFELRWFHADGTAWLFRSQGMSRDELVTAALGAVPGSGVPIVLADPAFSSVAIGIDQPESYTQALADPNGQTQVQLSVMRDGEPFDNLVSAANVVDVTVAGAQAYSGQLANGSIVTVWDAGGGWWGQLYIGASLARAADGIIESVQAVAMTGA
jgi:hypothetical protein